MKNLLIGGVVYEGVESIKLPTKEGGMATYVDYDKRTKFKAGFVSSKSGIKAEMPSVILNENKKQFTASMALVIE